MSQLEKEIRQLLARNRDGSYSTKAGREDMLLQMEQQLKANGYATKRMHLSDLGGRHINSLVNSWQNQGLSEGTIKNRMSALRWLSEKIGNKGLVKPNNKDYSIANRQYVTNENKAQDLAKLSNVDKSKLSPNVALSVELQQNFGLRREEAMKFQPLFALGGHFPATAEKLMIEASWCKGGRYREIPITTPQQRELLQKVLDFAGSSSMIPNDKSYKQHINTFERETASAGIGQTHGLRHLYAQNRYYALTGWQCPAVGGFRQLSKEEKEIDKQARLQISSELGHGRIQVTSIYLGSWSRG